MTTKTMEAVSARRTERDPEKLRFYMHAIAWLLLVTGAIMSLISLDPFSDKNLPLMLGIGLMVGSVFTYTIGTAISLVHKRNL